ncbi:uncharacterized protein EV420DRAFT_1179415 [Desarmillaria tabescens]|uniref:Secreted protein n=1 Tax=Armillaria tabescens TaxID=1929756 RepID=A0AA39TXD1_ARMTA|nr:uncharacterized protein EV420DRAFT_1179415 [Desarmillaria tabescens]KAK0462240.1 hypothetical protein EV420DRAFT_1179415 [Desarmillaria tabescens]
MKQLTFLKLLSSASLSWVAMAVTDVTMVTTVTHELSFFRYVHRNINPIRRTGDGKRGLEGHVLVTSDSDPHSEKSVSSRSRRCIPTLWSRAFLIGRLRRGKYRGMYI